MSTQRYNLNTTPLEKLDMRLLYVTHSRYGKDWDSTLHTHHFTEIFYIVKGNCSFRVENQEFTVKANDLIIINPNVTHTEVGLAGQSLEYIVLGVSGLQFKDETQDHSYDYSIHHMEEHKGEIFPYLNTLLHEVQARQEYYEIICQNLLEVFILAVIRHIKKTVAVAPIKKITRECRFIEQYINEHFSEDITLQTLSNLTYLNKYYLVHSFKEYKGISPINYLIDRRISESKHLLDTTNHSVAKIATMVGFSSQSYFSQIFKKETNMTPNQYRKTRVQYEL